MPDREFDIVVVGASGLTGRLVAERIARHGSSPDGRAPRWAATGRDPSRTAAALAGLPGGVPTVLRADLRDAGTLPALTARAAVVLNLAGPYTPTARELVAACVATGTHYADLSGEIPLLRGVIDRFHDAAVAARVRVVQMAGWEALPADLTTLLASRRAVAPSGEEGPGAGGGIAEVLVVARFHRVPEGRIGLSQAVSAGTMASVVGMLDDPEAALLGRTDVLLPTAAGAQLGGVRLRPLRAGGRVLAPFVPVAFLNAPVVHRTAGLRAAEAGAAYRPARYREGDDVGPGGGAASLPALGRGWLRAGVQGAILGLARAPAPVRRGIAAALRRRLPASGTGPGGRFLTDWAWTVQAEARTADGRVGTARLDGHGHPGYAATAAMLAEVGLRAAFGRAPERYGCLTPALALGSLDLAPWFVDGLALS